MTRQVVAYEPPRLGSPAASAGFTGRKLLGPGKIDERARRSDPATQDTPESAPSSESAAPAPPPESAAPAPPAESAAPAPPSDDLAPVDEQVRAVVARLAAMCIISGEILAGTARTIAGHAARGWRALHEVGSTSLPVVQRAAARLVRVVQRAAARLVRVLRQAWALLLKLARRAQMLGREHGPVVRRRSARWIVAVWFALWIGAAMLVRTVRRIDGSLAVRSVAFDIRVGSTIGAGVGGASAFLRGLVEAGSIGHRWSRRLRLAEVDAPPAAPRRVAVRIGAVVCGTAAVVAAVLAVCGVALRFAMGHAGQSLVLDSQAVTLPPLPQRSVVFASDKSPTAVLHGDQDRQPVRLDQISPVAINAVVDTEDDRFWSHGGIDPRGILRALTRDISTGTASQGGSTITQQLVKNALLTPKRNIGRKLTEMVLADRIERRYGKPAVLERYLNTVYFGEGAYGIESAAETYFGTYASRLNPAQAALLAGVIQDPSGHDPLRNPAGARARRQAVLELLVNHRHLDPAGAAAAVRDPLPTQINHFPQGRDYFTEAVRQELLADPRLGPTVDARNKALLTGGLQIHTTLDRRMQQDAEAAVAAGLPKASMPLSAAVASVDPATGAIRAVVGGTSFGANQYNAALGGAGRQPGSSFKVFTLVAALEQGVSPNDVVDGSTPCSIPNPGGHPDPWQPNNYEGEVFGQMSLTDATAYSVNCAYARLALRVGLAHVAATAHAMGITGHLNVVPSMTLGTNDVTPLQMASAYATLAADGVYHQPHLVEQVDRPDGSVLFRNTSPGKQVIPPEIAREATQVLQQVVIAGTGQAAALADRPVAGKTGTAENYQDAWFVGYTPNLASAVWMGDPAGEQPMRGVGGIDVVGGSYPARMWSGYMAAALAPLPVVGFTAPDNLTVPASVPNAPGTPAPRPASPSTSAHKRSRSVPTTAAPPPTTR